MSTFLRVFPPPVVVKVGGSLYDHPRLGPGLNAFLDPLVRAGPVWLVPGGGAAADAVRELDRTHRLGEEVAHWLALRSLSVTALFLAGLVGDASVVEDPYVDRGDGLSVVDCYGFALSDDGRPGSLPHSWAVTTDSIAARVAAVFGASRLVLLKSVDVPPATPWAEAAARGWVDAYFPAAVVEAAYPIEVVNFRRQLDAAYGE